MVAEAKDLLKRTSELDQIQAKGVDLERVDFSLVIE